MGASVLRCCRRQAAWRYDRAMPWFTRSYFQAYTPARYHTTLQAHYEFGRRWDEHTKVQVGGGQPVGPSGNEQILDFLNRHDARIEEFKMLSDSSVMYRAEYELD
jgi:hypothetical protein